MWEYAERVANTILNLALAKRIQVSQTHHGIFVIEAVFDDGIYTLGEHATQADAEVGLGRMFSKLNRGKK